jgi:phage terminase large subunit-like protein
MPEQSSSDLLIRSLSPELQAVLLPRILAAKADPEELSANAILSYLPPKDLAEFTMLIPEDLLKKLRSSWAWSARPKQLPPSSNWRTGLLLAGRGFGKTRTGSEWVHAQVAQGKGRIAIAGPTAADVRDVLVEGPSGLLATGSERDRPRYEPSKRRVTWSNGAVATQLPPSSNWRTWLLLAGRGFGKTRTGSEWVQCSAPISRSGFGGRNIRCE